MSALPEGGLAPRVGGVEILSFALAGVGILAAASHRKPDRHAQKPERLAQSVGEKPLVALGDGVDLIAEQNEERRPGFRLRHVADLYAPAGDGGRRRRFDDRRKPAVEPARRNALVPEFVRLD